MWQEPLISIGQDTYIANALRYAGAESVLQTKQDWPRVGWEEVVRLQPIIWCLLRRTRRKLRRWSRGMKNQPGWRDLKAVSENKIAIISEAIDLPAPRIVDAIEELARKLHPEAFVEAPRVPVSISQRTSASSGCGGDCAMRTLTFNRVLWICAALLAVLFAVVLVAIKGRRGSDFDRGPGDGFVARDDRAQGAHVVREYR